MTEYLNWPCASCGKYAITISLAGILYCANSHMAYGESMQQKLFELEVYL